MNLECGVDGKCPLQGRLLCAFLDLTLYAAVGVFCLVQAQVAQEKMTRSIKFLCKDPTNSQIE